MQVRIYSSLDDFPAGYTRLFDEAAKESFYLSLPWFRNLIDTTSKPGDELRLYGVEDDTDDARPLALLVARRRVPRSALTGARRLEGFVNFYSILFGLVLSPAEPDHRPAIRMLVTSICAEVPRWNSIHFRTLDANSPAFHILVQEFRAAGMIVDPYFHFSNCYENTEDGSFAAYMARRSSNVRHTLKRRMRKLHKNVDVRVEIITDLDGLDAGLPAYEKVYAASWKKPEPYPRFIEGLLRECARKGSLRLGILYADGEPVATQLCIVSAGAALMYKTAYDERLKKLSVGTPVILKILEHVIEVDKVREIDFGAGDEAYKKEWMSDIRERWGIFVYNPRTARGVLEAFWDIAGRGAMNVFRLLSGRRYENQHRRPTP